MKINLRMGLGGLGIILILMGGWFLWHHITFPLPEKEFHYVWLPQNAEIQPSERVQPGTFKISVPMEEFKTTTTNQKVTVVYDENRSRVNRGIVEYWRADGDGIFHYTYQEMPPVKHFSMINWKITFHKESEQAFFSYVPKGKHFRSLALALLILALGLMSCGFSVLPEKIIKKLKEN